jgi:hypothetical protein
MGANDLWDVACWCGWSSTRHERRELALEAADAHRSDTKESERAARTQGPVVVRSTTGKRKTGRGKGSQQPQATQRARQATITKIESVVVCETPRVIMDELSDSRYRIVCRRCRFIANRTDRSAAIELAEQHAQGKCRNRPIAEAKATPKRSKRKKSKKEAAAKATRDLASNTAAKLRKRR